MHVLVPWMMPGDSPSPNVPHDCSIFSRLPLHVILDHPTSNDDEGRRCAAAAQMEKYLRSGVHTALLHVRLHLSHSPRASPGACKRYAMSRERRVLYGDS
jgi:hypothetical protein